MLNCLIDYIGLEGCSNNAPDSGIYINSLPGIDLKMVDNLADAEQVNFNGVWDDVQLRASKRFESDVRAEFHKKYKLKSITKSINIGKDIDTTSITGLGADLRGFTIELNNDNDSFVSSNLQVINIQALYLYLPANGNTTIKIYDLDLGTLLQTIAVTGVAGWNTISVLGRFVARRLFVGYDATAINSAELDITDLINGCTDCDKSDYNNYNKFIQGASSTIAAPTTVSQGNNTFGLSGLINVYCSFESIICNNLDVFSTPFWYLLGIELMNERLYTSRLNNYTTFDKNKAKELKQLFEATYKGGYASEEDSKLFRPMPGELYLAVDGINLNLNDMCLECNSNIQFRHARL